jgi:peroxiredoxin
MGGGLGHLTRARAVLYTLGIETNAAIITSSNFAFDKRVTGDVKIIQVDKNFEKNTLAFQRFLQKLFLESNCTNLYIDSFPLGIIGEFSNFEFPENLKVNYLARRLKWRNYQKFQAGVIPKFNKTFILEPLEVEHQEFVNNNSTEQIEFEISYPAPKLSSPDKEILESILNEKKTFWLIVHTGSEAETEELMNFAEEMRKIEKNNLNLILISPTSSRFQKAGLRQFNLYPASILFAHAERIFTAAGFNAMHQTAAFRQKHFFIPFPRRFDDQFARACFK